MIYYQFDNNLSMTSTTKMSSGLRIWITNQLAFLIRIRIIFNWPFGSGSVIQDLRVQGSGTERNDNGSCPASQVKKNQAHLLNREPLSWSCVSDLLLLIRRELLRAVTLDDSTPQCRISELRVWSYEPLIVSAPSSSG